MPSWIVVLGSCLFVPYITLLPVPYLHVSPLPNTATKGPLWLSILTQHRIQLLKFVYGSICCQRACNWKFSDMVHPIQWAISYSIEYHAGIKYKLDKQKSIHPLTDG